MNNIYEEASKQLDIPVDRVKKIYRYYWKYIRETIKLLPLKSNLTEEEYSQYRTSFNIPSLGKLHCTYEEYTRMNNRFNNLKKFLADNERDCSKKGQTDV